MKNILFFLLLLINTSVAQSLQPIVSWTKTFGGSNNDEGWAIDKTSDGGYILAGYTISLSSNNWSDIYIIKTDANGEVLWSKIIGDTLDEYASDIKQLPDGNFIIAGYGRVNSPNHYDALLIKIDQDGNVIWNKSFGGSDFDQFTAVEIVSDGFVLVGTTKSISPLENREVYLLKTDYNGNVEYQRTYNFGQFSEGKAIKQLYDGGFVIVGTTYKSNSGYDIYVLRCDNNGNFIWQKSFGGANPEQALSVIQLPTSKEIYLTGYTLSFGNDYSDIFIMKLNELGDSLWFKTYGYFGNDYGNEIKITSDYNLVVTGYGRLDNSNQIDVLLLKTDLQGNLLWLVNHGGIFEDRGYDFVETDDYGYAVIGNTKTINNTTDIYLIKFDSEYTIDAPEILSIIDVPNDNGKKVFVKWNASKNDGNFTNPVIKYSIWRNDDNFWTFVGEVPAIGLNYYSIVAPTLFDSTIVSGIYWSIFKVVAHGTFPYILAASNPDSGYSLDNLIPHTPDSLRVIVFPNYVKLMWSEPVDEDFQYFAVYRDTVPNFDILNRQPVARLTNTYFDDNELEFEKKYYYKVVAYDFSGNMSLPSNEVSVLLTGTDKDNYVPKSYILYQNYPNPFNNSTNIVFEIPEKTNVKLSIYDALGRELENLINQELSIGKYSIRFEAKNYPSGVYFYKLETEKFKSLMKMILLK